MNNFKVSGCVCVKSKMHQLDYVPNLKGVIGLGINGLGKSIDINIDDIDDVIKLLKLGKQLINTLEDN